MYVKDRSEKDLQIQESIDGLEIVLNWQGSVELLSENKRVEQSLHDAHIFSFFTV